MTFSILSRDAETGELGCAAATGNLAVGAWVLHAEAEVGVVATQGRAVSVIWGAHAMRALARGHSAQRAVDEVVSADRNAAARQLLALDAAGHAAGWTGADNPDVKGHDPAPGLAVAGNWLANQRVLPAMKRAFAATRGAMAMRLLAALAAAADTGGDTRGVRSAALQVVSAQRPPLDLRIDYSETPVADLAALYRRTRHDSYREFLSWLPTLSCPQRR